MTKVKSLKDIVISNIKKPIDIIIEEKQIIDNINITSTYATFLLFYSFLKAKKIGQPRKGGWMGRDIKIQQRGTEYIFTYQETEYIINETNEYDLSDIIFTYITI